MQAAPWNYNCPPTPADGWDARRWAEGKRRAALLSGQWASYLEDRLYEHFGLQRRPVLGRGTLQRNPFRRVCGDLAVVYHEAPIVRHISGDVPEVAGREGLLAKIGHWPQMCRFQAHLVGLREMLLRIDWSDRLGRPWARQVAPHVVLATAEPSTPHIPVEVRELRWRTVNRRGFYAWDWVSVADPAAPFFRVVEAQMDGRDGRDVTEEVLGARFEGEAYPWRWTQGERAGEPWLPYVMYHAARGPHLWDPYEGIEVVEGTLDIGCEITFLGHVIRNASWPQRWGIDIEVVGAVTRDGAGGARAEVPTDPTSIVIFRGVEGPRTPQVGQFAPSADPESLARVIAMQEQSVLEMDGLTARDVTKDTTNPWSAESLTITREAQRRAQKRYWPELIEADKDTVERLCCVMNLQLGAGLPESGYEIRYRTLPLSREEQEERRKHNAEMIAQGRMSVVDAFMDEHPGLTRSEAEAELERIREDNERFGLAAGTAPTPLVQGGAEGGEPKATDAAEGEPKAGDADAADPALAGVEKKADLALNGAQLDALDKIVMRVAMKELPRETGVKRIMKAFTMTAEDADEQLGEVGRTFFLAAPQPAGTPPGGLANGQG